MAGSSPADIGANNELTIPPNQAVAYQSSDLVIAIGSSGLSGAVYSGSVSGGERFDWSFLDYDRIRPVSGAITQTSGGPDATFVVSSGATAVFELSNPFVPGVSPIDVIIAGPPGGPPVTLHQAINSVAPPGTPEIGLAQGITLTFNDPALASGLVAWSDISRA